MSAVRPWMVQIDGAVDDMCTVITSQQGCIVNKEESCFGPKSGGETGLDLALTTGGVDCPLSAGSVLNRVVLKGKHRSIKDGDYLCREVSKLAVFCFTMVDYIDN